MKPSRRILPWGVAAVLVAAVVVVLLVYRPGKSGAPDSRPPRGGEHPPVVSGSPVPHNEPPGGGRAHHMPVTALVSPVPVAAGSGVPPRGVAASQGTYRDRIVVTWQPSDGAVRYVVERRPAGSVKAPVSLREVESRPEPGYEDYQAGAGEFEYRVSAVTAAGVSAPSEPAVGWRAMLDAPAVLFATDRTYQDKICVTWDFVNGAARYELFRVRLRGPPPEGTIYGVDSLQAQMLEVADRTEDMTVTTCRETQFIDADVVTNVFYAYRVRAVDSTGGLSEFSKWDQGSTRPILASLPTPAWVRASSSEPGFIRIEWEHREGNPDCRGYEVWRSEQAEVFWAKVVNANARSPWVDRQVAPGVVYYYWVRSGDGGQYLSSFSPPAAGVAVPGPPD